LARDLSRELKREHFAEMAATLSKVPHFKAFGQYPQCCEVLETLPKIRCGKTCRGNGGRPQCGIRECCRGRGFDGCWLCDEFATCSKLDFLRGAHGDAHIRNLKKIRRHGTKAFVEGKRLWCSQARG